MFAGRDRGAGEPTPTHDWRAHRPICPQHQSLEQLLLPQREGNITENNSIPSNDTPHTISKTDQHPRFSLLKAATSPAVVCGVGNTVFVSTLGNTFVTLFYAGISCLSFLNEYRARIHSQNGTDSRLDWKQSSMQSRGALGYIREQLLLPGVCLGIDGLAFLGTGIAYLIANGFTPDASLKMAIFGAFSIASFAGARLSNLGIQRPPREPWWLEQRVHSLWRQIPSGLQNYLQNPGAIFATGNLPNYGMSLIIALSAAESVSLLHKLTIGLAAGCTLTGAALGMLPFLGKIAGKHKAAPCLVNGAGNFLFGSLLIHAAVTTATVAPGLVGCAAVAWGFGNFGMAASLLRVKEDCGRS